MRTETYKPEKKSIFKPTEKPKNKRSTKSKTKRKGQTGAKKSQRDGQQDEMKDTQDGTSSEDSETDDDNVMAYHALKEVESSPDMVPERVPLVQSPNTVVIRAKELEEEDVMKKEMDANQEGYVMWGKLHVIYPEGYKRISIHVSRFIRGFLGPCLSLILLIRPLHHIHTYTSRHHIEHASA